MSARIPIVQEDTPTEYPYTSEQIEPIHQVVCQCDCGSAVSVRYRDLRSGNTTSLGLDYATVFYRMRYSVWSTDMALSI